MPRIDGNNPLATSRLNQGLQTDRARSGGTGSSGIEGAAPADLAAISPRGRVIATAIGAVASAPDIRADRVEALKTAIANGTYHSNARDIAARLLAGGSLEDR